MPSNRLTPDELTALEELVAGMQPGPWDCDMNAAHDELLAAAPALLAMARENERLREDKRKIAKLVPKLLEDLGEGEIADALRSAIANA